MKRVYDSPGTDDGTRFLEERLWPRGMRKTLGVRSIIDVRGLTGERRLLDEED